MILFHHSVAFIVVYKTKDYCLLCIITIDLCDLTRYIIIEVHTNIALYLRGQLTDCIVSITGVVTHCGEFIGIRLVIVRIVP
ncbi:hypothetical protein D3C87_1465710 [compost metagenome]